MFTKSYCMQLFFIVGMSIYGSLFTMQPPNQYPMYEKSAKHDIADFSRKDAARAVCSTGAIVGGLGFWKHSMPFFKAARSPFVKLGYLTVFVGANATSQLFAITDNPVGRKYFGHVKQYFKQSDNVERN